MPASEEVRPEQVLQLSAAVAPHPPQRFRALPGKDQGRVGHVFGVDAHAKEGKSMVACDRRHS